VQPISDFELIRNTIARNNHYLDDRRYEDCARTFAEDGSIAGHTGRPAILEFMQSQGLGADPKLQRRHVVTNIAIDISGDQAHVDSDLLVYDKHGTEPWKLSAVGRYADRLTRQPDGKWLFADRRLDFVQ
jgi:SnoaL-like domain